MTKPLSDKEIVRRKVWLKSIEDYFGDPIEQESFERISKALKSGSTAGLSEEERKAAWTIRINLEDPVYKLNLTRA